MSSSMDEARWSWTAEANSGVLRIRVAGVIDDESNLGDILGALGDGERRARSVALDLGGIERINSIGVSRWLDFIGALSERVEVLDLERCSSCVVHQLGMIRGFNGTGRVRSVLAGYDCLACGARRCELVEASALADFDWEGARPCPACGEPLELDGLAEEYRSLSELTDRSGQPGPA